jgi:hypothetical protein
LRPFADLHTHTSYSDSKETPKSLLEKAKSAGLHSIAVTDHDTVSGLAEAFYEARTVGVEVVPGIELSCRYKSVEIHMVGLWIDPANKGLNDIIGKIEQSRFERAKKMVERLRVLGAAIEFDEVEAIAGKGVIGRPHVAQALVDRGRVEDFSSAFRLYIGREGPAYVRKLAVTPEEAIAAVHSAGGTAVMAHPLVGGPQREHVKEVCEMGIDALEANHPKLTGEQCQWLRQYAKARNIAVSGGSDWHGVGWSEGEMGDYGVTETEFRELYSRLPVTKSMQGGKNV